MNAHPLVAVILISSTLGAVARGMFVFVQKGIILVQTIYLGFVLTTQMQKQLKNVHHVPIQHVIKTCYEVIMNRRAQKIIKQIVGNDKDYKRLLPIGKVNIGYTGIVDNWTYDPHPDYRTEFLDESGLYKQGDDPTLIDEPYFPHTIDYTELKNIHELEKT